MVAWEWMVQRRGTSLDDLIRSGLETHEAISKYFQARGATYPTEAEVEEALLRVKPPVVKVVKVTPPPQPTVKKTPTRRPRKKKAT